MFDPQSFLDSEITESNSTSVTPVPIGEYDGIIKAVNVRSGTISKGERMGDPWASLEVQWTVEDEAVKTLLDRKEVVVRQSLMLDLLPSGGLDLGKERNVRLGRLRQALSLNEPGKPFSFRMLEGRMAKIAVTHREYEGNISAEVNGVLKQ